MVLTQRAPTVLDRSRIDASDAAIVRADKQRLAHIVVCIRAAFCAPLIAAGSRAGPGQGAKAVLRWQSP